VKALAPFLAAVNVFKEGTSMSRGPQDSDQTLERYRNYLMILAESRLYPRLRRMIDPADIVQETFLRAHRGQDGRRGGEAGLLAWLKVILRNVLTDALRKLRSTDNVELNAEIDQSSCLANNLLAADQSTPSQQAQRHEQVALLADALVQLPEAQREAIELQKLQGFSLSEIAESMGRSQTAVAGLIKRGLQNLRVLMKSGE
jgi:RNA polymerase sigma-70 factor (ECF subfamily)